jgi:predicted RNase H-like nuclease (RuvC/YqgF family)
MELQQILTRIEEKIAILGESKMELERHLSRAKSENESLYRINKELQTQLDELTEKNKELQDARSLQVLPDKDFREDTRQRINELVKEIDECITLLNK